MIIEIDDVIITVFQSYWVDKDLVRVTCVGKKEYVVKAGKRLSLDEIKGAVVKYELEQGRKKLYS
jgi:hypothetical protein